MLNFIDTVQNNVKLELVDGSKTPVMQTSDKQASNSKSALLSSSTSASNNERVNNFHTNTTHNSWESNSNESNDSAFYESNEMTNFKNMCDLSGKNVTYEGKRESVRSERERSEMCSVNEMDASNNDLETELMLDLFFQLNRV